MRTSAIPTWPPKRQCTFSNVTVKNVASRRPSSTFDARDGARAALSGGRASCQAPQQVGELLDAAAPREPVAPLGG